MRLWFHISKDCLIFGFFIGDHATYYNFTLCFGPFWFGLSVNK